MEKRMYVNIVQISGTALLGKAFHLTIDLIPMLQTWIRAIRTKYLCMGAKHRFVGPTFTKL